MVGRLWWTFPSFLVFNEGIIGALLPGAAVQTRIVWDAASDQNVDTINDENSMRRVRFRAPAVPLLLGVDFVNVNILCGFPKIHK